MGRKKKRRGEAEGSCRVLKKGDYRPARQGGRRTDYFWKYPNASGAWLPEFDAKGS